MFYLSGVDKLVQFDSEKSQMHGLRIRKKSVSEKAFDSPSHANSTCYLYIHIGDIVLTKSQMNCWGTFDDYADKSKRKSIA